MKISSFVNQSLLAACVVILSACTTQGVISTTQQAVSNTETRVGQITANLEARKLDEVPLYQRVPGMWFSDRVLPRSTAQRMPPVFDQNFVLREQTTLAITDVADIIRAHTGLTILINGDAIGSQRIGVDSVTSLKSLLDSTTSRFGMTWQYLDDAIQIQQSVVRTFVIDRPGFDTITVGSAGGAAKAGSKDPWTDILDAIRVVAPRARVSAMRSSNSITVADSPANVARIAELLEVDDRQASKKVTLLWKLVVFTKSVGGEAGLGFNYLKTAGRKLSFASPTSLVGTIASALKVESIAGESLGSEMILSLLNQSGSTMVVRDGITEISQNGRSDFGTEKEVFYISRSTPGVASSLTSSASVGLEQASVKVGLAGAFGATVFDSERMTLGYDFTVSSLDQLKSVTSAGTTLQSPETTKRYSRGQVPIKHGETWILSAETSDANSFDRRGILPAQGSILGGSETAGSNRDQWLLLVTPILTSKGI